MKDLRRALEGFAVAVRTRPRCALTRVNSGRTATAEARQSRWQGAMVLLGAPGAGKGTQARLLGERLRIPRVSTGDVIRDEIRNGTPLGRQAAEGIAAGELLSDRDATRLLESRLEDEKLWRAGFLLDGYPRTAPQAVWLAAWLQQHRRSLVVIELGIGYNEVNKRITGRRICPGCGAIYNVDSNPPKFSDVCDFCQTRVTVRSDDRVEVIEQRLRTYERETLPVLAVFRDAGVRIHQVDGELPPAEVSKRIARIIDEA